MTSFSQLLPGYQKSTKTFWMCHFNNMKRNLGHLSCTPGPPQPKDYLSLTLTKFLQPANLTIYTIWSLFKSSGRTRSSSAVTLARPSVSSNHNRSFRYASLYLWNQLPSTWLTWPDSASLSSWFTSSSAYQIKILSSIVSLSPNCLHGHVQKWALVFVLVSFYIFFLFLDACAI